WKSIHFDLFSIFPPIKGIIEMFQLHRSGFGEVFIALWHIHSVEPGFLGWFCIIKEQDIGSDGCIRCKYAVWHSYYCVKIEFTEQLFLDIKLSVICTKQKTIWQNHCCTTIFL